MKKVLGARVPLLLGLVWIAALALPGLQSEKVMAGDNGPVVRTIYFADPGAGLVHRVQAKFARKPKLRNLEPLTGMGAPTAVAVHPGGEFLLALDAAHGTIVKFDLEREKVVRRTRVPGEAVSVEFAADGDHAFIADRAAQAVHVYDARRGRILRSIDMDGEPLGLAVTARGTAVYAANAGSNVISRIDGKLATASSTRLRRGQSLVTDLDRTGSCEVNGGLGTLRMAGPDAFNYVMWTCGSGLASRFASRVEEADFEEQTSSACDSGEFTDQVTDDCVSTDFDSEESISEDSVSEDSVSEDSVSEDSVSEDSVSEDSVSEDSVSEDSISEDSVSEDSTSEDSTSEDSDSEEGEEGTSAEGERAIPIPAAIPGRPDGYVATDIQRMVRFTRRGVCQADGVIVTFRPSAASESAEGRTFLWDFNRRAREMVAGVAFDAVFGAAGSEVYVNAPCTGNCRPNQIVRRTRTLEIPDAVAISHGAMRPLGELRSCSAEE